MATKYYEDCPKCYEDTFLKIDHIPKRDYTDAGGIKHWEYSETFECENCGYIETYECHD